MLQALIIGWQSLSKKLPNRQRKDIKPKCFFFFFFWYEIVCGKIRSFFEEKFLILLVLQTKVVLLYVILFSIYFDTLILLHWMLAVNKLALKGITTLDWLRVSSSCAWPFFMNMRLRNILNTTLVWNRFQTTVVFDSFFIRFLHSSTWPERGFLVRRQHHEYLMTLLLSFSINSVRSLTKRVLHFALICFRLFTRLIVIFDCFCITPCSPEAFDKSCFSEKIFLSTFHFPWPCLLSPRFTFLNRIAVFCNFRQHMLFLHVIFQCFRASFCFCSSIRQFLYKNCICRCS